jgi:hypothetical protein
MYKRKTLFVVGAGASREANLPDGRRLREMLISSLDIRGDGFEPISGNLRIFGALSHHAQTQAPRANVNEYLHACWRIRDALPQAFSIDHLLDAHQHDNRIELCGKLGIAAAILEAEAASLLYVQAEHERPNFNALANTWYSAFMQQLTEGVAKKDIETILTNVAFVSFNYDRCVEHFLFHALINYYGISPQESADVLNNHLEIHHPYGVAGQLPWQKGARNVVKFGAYREANLLAVASQLKTFTERVEDPATLDPLKVAVATADRFVFLGFAFHEQNMRLLKPEAPCSMKQTFATTLGMSGSDSNIVKDQLAKEFGAPNEHLDLQLTSNECRELFQIFRRSMTAP